MENCALYDVLLLIEKAYTDMKNYHPIRVCLGPCLVLTAPQTHGIPRKTLWAFSCSLYKLGACSQVMLISTSPRLWGGELPSESHVSEPRACGLHGAYPGSYVGDLLLGLTLALTRCGWKEQVVSPH